MLITAIRGMNLLHFTNKPHLLPRKIKDGSIFLNKYSVDGKKRGEFYLLSIDS